LTATIVWEGTGVVDGVETTGVTVDLTSDGASIVVVVLVVDAGCNEVVIVVEVAITSDVGTSTCPILAFLFASFMDCC
jgi:hypothetical protein